MPKSSIQSVAAALFTLVSFVPCNAKSFYVDPATGSIANDGSDAHPWKTLQEVIDSNKICSRKYETKPAGATTPLIVRNPDAPVKAGDTIFCKNGYHGAIFASEYYHENWVTIMAYPGHQPKLAQCEFCSGCKWRLVGFTISPSFAPVYRNVTLINFVSHNWTGAIRECVAEACTAYSVPDASAWTKEQWDTLSCNAISLPGSKMVARGNLFKNVNFGISVSGDSCLIEHNTVENFAGDGMRGLGDYDVFQYNTVKNCYAVNANHDDGFQSWSVGDSNKVGTGVVYGMVLRGNTIINYEDPKQPFHGTLQGIGCFDGMFENWLVENNVIITDHWHGITLSGATNCTIINNTVVDINDTTPGPPWIRISEHKDGRLPNGCVVRNNLTTALNCSSEGVTTDHNIMVKKYADFFVDYAHFDVHLRAGCSAIDSGSSEGAPTLDREGRNRPAGGRVDAGAYEYGAMKVLFCCAPALRHTFTCNYAADGLIVRLPGKNGSLGVFDLQGRVIAAITCTGEETVRIPLARRAGQSLIVRFQTGGKKYAVLTNKIMQTTTAW